MRLVAAPVNHPRDGSRNRAATVSSARGSARTPAHDPTAAAESVTARTFAATEAGILDAALRAIVKVGLRGLSIAEICREAQVSRGTVYRYFSSRTQLLELLGEYTVGLFESTLAAAIEAEPEREQRIRIVIGTIFSFRHHPIATQMTEAEPEFLLTFFRKELPRFMRIIAEALGTELTESPPVRSGVLTVTQAAELVLRVSLSASILPEGAPEEMPRLFYDLWTTEPGAAG